MPEFLKTIRDQMVFTGVFFAIFGWINTDAYYSAFGMKYQFLGLGYDHILYRGFTLLYFEWKFALVFVLIVVSIFVSRSQARFALGRFHLSGEAVSYALLAASLMAGSWLAYGVGLTSAVSDMYEDTTSLRKVTFFHSDNPSKQEFWVGLRGGEDADRPSALLVLARSSSEIAVFVPPTLRAAQPRVSVHRIRLSSNDYYTDQVPLFQ